MKKQQVLVMGPNFGTQVYSSLRATSRALSGKGSDGRRSTITRRIQEGGGHVGEVFVQAINN